MFIVAGAFAGLDQVIADRVGKKGVGFGANLDTKDEREKVDLFSQVRPEDLVKFGLIPEFIGRLPVVATVDNLDRESLVKVLTEPKNSLVKQYSRLFEMDDCELDIEQPGQGASSSFEANSNVQYIVTWIGFTV